MSPDAPAERERDYLSWMAESIQRIREYTAAGTEQILLDGSLRDAVVWRLETIGEASTHLSAELKARHPEIPWRGVADFRNIAAHAYRALQVDVVKDVVDSDLEPLRDLVDEELRPRP